MNTNKFYKRTQLFSDILYEVLNVESNYRNQLSFLNSKLKQIIQDYNKEYYNKKLVKSQTEKFKKKIVIKEDNLNNTCTFKKGISIENYLSEKEENPLIDKLVSESLQQFLAFYKTKHQLISKEVSNLGLIIYGYFSSQKKYNNYDDLHYLERYKEEFDVNYNKLMDVKEQYFDKMKNLESIIHQEEENKKQFREQNKLNEIIELNQTKINDKLNEKEKDKIDELIHLRKKYKKRLIKLTRYQKTYISKVNEIGEDIRQFNFAENNIVYDIFKVFEENLTNLIKEIKNYCIIYEHNKKLIEDLNIELGNNMIYDDRIYQNYQFEEYTPQSADINNQVDLSVIKRMNKLIGFEFDKIKTNKMRDSIDPFNEIIMYNNIDDNLLFILLMDKFTDKESILNEKETNLMKKLFSQEKYIREFLNKLNNLRIDKKFFNNKERFNILFEFFTLIYTKISFADKKWHDLVKFLMILSETFNYKEGDKKIFLNTILETPQELKDSQFWIHYIEIEIENEYKKYKDKKAAKYEYIVLLSNSTHLKEFSVPKETIIEILQYFQDKYKFTNEEVDLLKKQLKCI